MKEAWLESYKFNKTFSGTDTLAFIILPGCTPVCLGALTTISYSMLRNKRPVINIGRTNINGVTRGSRIFAGTMIFTLINQHWLREIQDLPENANWIGAIDELKADELPLFDIMIISANEYGSWCSMYIYGIDLTDEAQTISVEDLFTENVFQFVARDVSTFKTQTLNDLRPSGSGLKDGVKPVAVTERTYILPDSAATIEDIASMERSYNQTKLLLDKKIEEDRSYPHIPRDLYEAPNRYFIGNDVLEVQTMLSKMYNDVSLNGIFDHKTSNAVKKYQSDLGLVPDGIVNQRLYVSLLNDTNTNGVRMATCMNKNGAYVYREPRMRGDIVNTIAYKDSVRVYDFVPSTEEGNFHKFYRTHDGYVLDTDMFSSYYNSHEFEFPTVGYRYSGPYTEVVKDALERLYHYTSSSTGEIDEKDVSYIKKFQRERFLPETGVLGQEEWLLLESELGDIVNDFTDDNFNITFSYPPGTYTVGGSSIYDWLNDFNANITCNNSINVKITATSKYEDGKSKTVSELNVIKNRGSFNLMSCQKAFIYNPTTGSMPKTVEIIIYPYNKMPYKWFFDYQTGGAE